MDITVMEVIITPENRQDVSDFLVKHRKDIRITQARGYPSEEVFRAVWEFGIQPPKNGSKDEHTA